MKLQVKLLIAFALVAVLFGQTVYGWRSFKVVFTSFPYQFNAESMDVKLQILNNTGETTIDAVINFTDDIDDVTLRYVIALEVNEGNYTALVNRSVNFCNFLQQRSVEPLLRVIYEDLLKQNNFIKQCPIKKGSYTLRDYRIDEEMLPSYVPETSFFIDLKISLANGEALFDGRLNGKIDKSKGFNNLKMFSLG